jgi:hypothetical protein
MAIEFELGQKWSVVYGEWIQDDVNGDFEVVDKAGIEDTINKNSGLLCTKRWVGKGWQFRKLDCVSLAAEYIDLGLGTNYWEYYMNEVKGEFYRNHLHSGIAGYFDEHMTDFKIVEDSNDIRKYDVLVYQLWDIDDLQSPHIGVYIGDEKLLTIDPGKMSSEDPLDRNKVIRVYRCIHA